MNSNLGILFLLMLFTGLPLQFLLALPFALATPVPAPPVPLDWPDQKATHTHNPEDHPLPGLYCGPTTHKYGYAGGCVRRERDVYKTEGKRDGTVVKVPERELGRPTVCACRLIYPQLPHAGTPLSVLFFPQRQQK